MSPVTTSPSERRLGATGAWLWIFVFIILSLSPCQAIVQGAHRVVGASASRLAAVWSLTSGALSGLYYLYQARVIEDVSDASATFFVEITLTTLLSSA